MNHMRIYKLAIARLIVFIGLLCIVAICFIPVSEAREQRHSGYDTESLQGSYALVGTGGAHSAASVGIETYDGKGIVTRSLVLNEPDADQSRRVISISGKGSYSVKANGMGRTKITNTLPDGTTFVSDLDFVITRARVSKPREMKLATELFSMLRESGISAPLVTFTLTRLPD